MSQKTDAILRELRAFGLAYPGTHTKSPWPGHLDLAVKDKTFAYLSLEGEPLGISCKLPKSNAVALMLPFCKPAGYGLGKSGWVDAKFTDDNIPVDMLKEWIDESYRAQAPKKLIDQIATAPPATAAPAKKKAPAKKATGAAARRAAAPAARRARRTRRS
jgi:predicted DNA-binding protein (MmcQ/YjbR family)